MIATGLVYEIFMVKLPAPDLFNALVRSGWIDETESMMAERAEEKEHLARVEVFMNSPRTPGKSGDDIAAEFGKLIEVSSAVQAYRKRNEGKLQVAFRALAARPEWTIGWYYHFDLYLDKAMQGIPRKIFGFYVSTLLNITPEVHFVGYHHGCNDGNVYFYAKAGDNVHLTEYEHEQNEHERFWRHVSRLQRETGVPYRLAHQSMKRGTGWQKHLRFEIVKKDNDATKGG